MVVLKIRIMINQHIKLVLSFALVLFGCINPLYEEDVEEFHLGKTKEEMMNYFSKNKDNLEPIEGLWTLGVVRTLYDYGIKIVTESEPNRMDLAVIKEDDLFRIYNMNGDPNNFIASFTQTDESGIYDYKCYFTETKDMVSTTASMFGNSMLRYEYDAPKGIMMNYYYNKGPSKGSKEVKRIIEDENLRLNWKFFWFKYVSSDSTKTYLAGMDS
jgi:hypothetical protein